MIYFLKKALAAVVTLWLVATVVFFLVKGVGAEDIIGEGRTSPRVVEQLRRQWLLDRPLHEQYFAHMRHLATLDSMPSRRPPHLTLRQVLGQYLPSTISLGLRSITIAILVGVPIGVLAAVYHNRLVDRFTTTAALFCVSVPSFILGSFVIYGTIAFPRHFTASNWTQSFWTMWVPAACLSAFPLAAILRLTRASMLEALREDYVRTARAKGLSELGVVVRHALRNALTPVVTYFGPVMAGLLTGSIVIERLFVIPGIGRFFVESVGNRDMPLIMGLTVFYCALLVFFNLLVDAIYPLLNPRLRSA